MISDIKVDPHDTNFSIFPAHRAGTYASKYYKGEWPYVSLQTWIYEYLQTDK